MVAVVLMTTVSAMAQRIEVVDAEGNGIPLVSVTTEDGVFVGKTDLNGVLDNVKGARKVGQIVHNGGRSYATLDAGRMQRYQDEKQGNKSLMKQRQEKDYAYEYVNIYRLPDENKGRASNMTLEELQAYERQHNIPSLSASQLTAIQTLKKHY